MSENIASAGTLPNFLLAGAAKCGTTSLYYYLRQHPDVFMSPIKEPDFLTGAVHGRPACCRDALAASHKVKTFAEYSRLFEQGTGCKAIGEASVSTLLYFRRTVPAIKRHLGDPKIVIILRDPVERAYSAYKMLVRDGWERLSFAESLKCEEKRRQEGYRMIWRYREVGLYADQVRAFQRSFSQVQILLYDDLKRDGEALIRSVYRFLEVDPRFVPDVRHAFNASGVPRWPMLNTFFVRPQRLHKIIRAIGWAVMGETRWIRLRERLRSVVLEEAESIDPEIEQQLRQFFREDVLRLQEYAGRDLSAWTGGGPL